MRIIAIDPGVSTGVAIRRDDGGFDTATITEHRDLWNLLLALRPEQVIIEQFATSGQISKYGLHTVRLVGSVEALCYVNKWRLMVRPPQARRGQLGKAKELLGKGHTQHEVDALAHLLTYEWNQSRGNNG